MPQIHDAAHLGAALAERMEAGTNGPCFCGRSWGVPALTRELSAAGREYRDFPLYELRAKPGQREEAFRRLREKRSRTTCCSEAPPAFSSFVDGLMQTPDQNARCRDAPCPASAASAPSAVAAWEEEKGRLETAF